MKNIMKWLSESFAPTMNKLFQQTLAVGHLKLYAEDYSVYLNRIPDLFL